VREIKACFLLYVLYALRVYTELCAASLQLLPRHVKVVVRKQTYITVLFREFNNNGRAMRGRDESIVGFAAEKLFLVSVLVSFTP
jgi:hypothetical protein